MIKSFKYRISPTPRQELKLLQTLTTCRFLYNNSLSERINKYKESKESISYVEQANNLTQNKNKYQQKVHSQVLQGTLKRLDQAFSNFFRRVKTKKLKAGFPRFKSDNNYNSFYYPQSGFKITNDQKRIKLSKIGEVKLKYSREVENIKTCIVVRDGDQWFVVLTSKVENNKETNYNDKEVGIDVGISNYLTLNDGKTVENPRILKSLEKKLAKEQRRLSRKQKWSNNRQKQKLKVIKVHRKINNSRNDFLHKLSTNLVKDYGKIVFEDLNIKGMLKNHKLAKHISDCSWYKLIEMTRYKAESAGCEFVLVNARNTSQICSNCDSIEKKTLSERVHKCSSCGLELDRDHNAAINILNRAGTARINAFGGNVRPSLDSLNQNLAVSMKEESPPNQALAR